MSDETKFRFQLHVDSVLSVDQIWPDGNAPDNPTIEDVARVTGQSDPTKISVTEMCRLVDEWNLIDGTASITEATSEPRLQEEAQAAADNAAMELLERAENAERRADDLRERMKNVQADNDTLLHRNHELRLRAEKAEAGHADAIRIAKDEIRRAEKAEARVAELEAEVEKWEFVGSRAAVMPPPGHVAVMLPREDVPDVISGILNHGYLGLSAKRRIEYACRKALEGNDE